MGLSLFLRRQLGGWLQTPAPPGATSTTAVPGPATAPVTAATTADVGYANFAVSLELAMVALYNEAMPKVTGDNVATVARFRDHHQNHAQAYSEAIATAVPGTASASQPNGTLLITMVPQLQALPDERSVLQFMVNLENQMAATYVYALTLLTTPAIYERMVTILPVESEHAAVLGVTLQLPVDGLFVNGAFENAAVGDGTDTRSGFDMAAFPVG